MAGKLTFIALVAVLAIPLARARAQDDFAPRRSPSLSERLQRFRHDLLGDGSVPRQRGPRPTIAAERKGATPTPSRPTIVTPPPPSDDDIEVPVQELESMPLPRGAASPDSLIRMPSRMQVQGARPARRDAGETLETRPSQSLRDRLVPQRRISQQITPEEPEEIMPEDGDVDPDAVAPEDQDPSIEEEAPGEDEPQGEEAPEDDGITPIEGDDMPEEEGAQPEDEPLEPAPRSAKRPVETEEVAPRQRRPEARTEPRSEPRAVRATNKPPIHEEDQQAPPKMAARTPATVLFTAQGPVIKVEASGPRTVRIGKEAEFVVQVRNSGAAANNVVISIDIPSFADVAAAHPTSGSATSGDRSEGQEPFAWRIDRLNANAQEKLVLKLIPRKSAPMNLAVNWTFAPETSQTQVDVLEPKLAMAISGPTEVQYGEAKIYKLSVSNPGNGDTENVSLGLLPIGRSSDAAQTHKLGNLKPGETKTVDVELTARQAGTLLIKAQAFADGGLRSEAVEKVLVRRAALQVEVEAPKVKYAGTAGAFHVKVVNTGNALAENVKIAALLPPEAKYLSASGGGRFDQQQGRVIWVVGGLQAGGQRTFDLQCNLITPGDNRTQFIASAEGDLSAAATASTRVDAIADLKLEVRDPQGPVAVGEDAVYEVHVRNRGTKAAERIELIVFFSEGLEPTSAEGGPHDVGSGQVIFKPVASLPAGDALVYKIHARADAAGNHIFRAEVNCHSLKTKLAAEEATHFYGEQQATRPTEAREPTPAAEPEDPTPLPPEEEAPAAEEDDSPRQLQDAQP